MEAQAGTQQSMDPLAPGFAISCRACGAPGRPDAERCPHCGSVERYDTETRARLVVHRARMRRALQQLRALVASEVSWALSHGHVYGIAILFLVLPLAGILLGTLPGLVVILLLQPRGPRAVLAALALVAGSTIGLAGGLALFYAWAKRLAARSRAAARELVLGMETTAPVVCPGCGGHAAVVMLGPTEHAPCPWCASTLLPSGDDGATRAVAVALLAQHAAAAQRLATRSKPSAVRRKPPPVAGFEVTGGTVVRGTTFDVPVRAFNELVGDIFVQRVEVAVDTGLLGEVLLVRPAVESTMRNLTREWGYALPELAAPSPRTGWLAFAAEAALPTLPALASTLDKLGPSDAVLLDPAGLSLWRQVRGLDHAWTLVKEHHETMAALALAIRDGHGG